MKYLSAFCVSLILIFWSLAPAFSNAEEQVYAIQNKIFHKSHEIGLNINYIPNDDFYDAFPIGMHYTYSFNEHFSWEVAKFQYALNRDKDIKKDLENDFGIKVSEFSKPKYFLHSNLIFKPLYGKDAYMNRSIINRESYISIGGGIAQYEKQYSTGGITSNNVPSFNVTIGTKYFINNKFAINLEIGDMINLKKEKNENYVYFGIGLAYRFDLSPRKTKKDSKIERLDKYLRSDDYK